MRLFVHSQHGLISRGGQVRMRGDFSVPTGCEILGYFVWQGVFILLYRAHLRSKPKITL